MLAIIRCLLPSSLLSKTINSKQNHPVILHGCEAWFLTLKDEHSLRVFENWVMRKTIGPTRDQAEGEWRRLRNE